MGEEEAYSMDIRGTQILLGLKKYRKGDWRNISQNFIAIGTPTHGFEVNK